MEFSELDLRKAVHIREVLLLAVGKREPDAESAATADTIMKRMKSVLSIAEYNNWLTTEDGYRMQILAGGYGPETEDLREALLRLLLRRDLASWKWATAIAYEQLSKKWMTVQINEKMIERNAEEICVREGFRPFHWNNVMECSRCGLVPCSKEEEKCHWCNTTTGRIYAESKESGGEGLGDGEAEHRQVSDGTKDGNKDQLH